MVLQDQYGETNYFCCTSPSRRSPTRACGAPCSSRPSTRTTSSTSSTTASSSRPTARSRPGRRATWPTMVRFRVRPGRGGGRDRGVRGRQRPTHHQLLDDAHGVEPHRGAVPRRRAGAAIGVDTTIDQIEQSTLINNACSAIPRSTPSGGATTAGSTSTAVLLVAQLGRRRRRKPGAELRPSPRSRDRRLARAVAVARPMPTSAAAIAEDINRRFAEQCYIIPCGCTKWGSSASRPSRTSVARRCRSHPNGISCDGAGFPGQVWLTAVFLAE